MNQFIAITTDTTPVYINVGNIIYLTDKVVQGMRVPMMVMVNGITLACPGHTVEEILGLIGGDVANSKTEVPDAIKRSFDDIWASPEDAPDESPEVDNDADGPVEYKDGGENPRSDDDLLPQ